jgi:hypothetical protein
MRNAGAHEILRHSDAEVSAAFDVVEDLLNALYLLKAKAARLPRCKDKSAIPGP